MCASAGHGNSRVRARAEQLLRRASVLPLDERMEERVARRVDQRSQKVILNSRGEIRTPAIDAVVQMDGRKEKD